MSIGSSWVYEADNQGMKIETKNTVTNIADGMIFLDLSRDVMVMGAGTLNGKSTVEISSGIQTNATIEMTVSSKGIEMSIMRTSTMKKV